jgi:hypothetical protein
VGAVLREQVRGCRTDTATATGNQRDSIGQQPAVNCIHAHILGHGSSSGAW